MASVALPVTNPFHDLSLRGLAKTIFRADLPEQVIRTMPAQAVYLALKQNGVGSSADLVELATVEQLRAFLDFDLWERDTFKEEHLWEWLALSSDGEELQIVQKLLKAIDLKLVALMIARHVKHRILDEPTENPPAAGYFTPDKGYTWISIEVEDSNKHFLLGRFLAVLFETDANLFYKLLSIPQIHTAAGLEEESFQERSVRLSAEGVPDAELAAEIHAPFSVQVALGELKAGGRYVCKLEVPAVEPLVYDQRELHPLQELLSKQFSNPELAAEITLIVNAAVVHFAVDFSAMEQLHPLITRVRGAINLGLELLAGRSGLSPEEVHAGLGIQKIYRVGLQHCLALRKELGRALAESAQIDGAASESVILSNAVNRPFPMFPEALSSAGSWCAVDGALSQELRAIEQLRDIDALRSAAAAALGQRRN